MTRPISRAYTLSVNHLIIEFFYKPNAMSFVKDKMTDRVRFRNNVGIFFIEEQIIKSND